MTAVGAIVVAAGKSSRMGGVDKVFAPLAGRPLLAHALATFQASARIQSTVLVTGVDRIEAASSALEPYGLTKLRAICAGGTRRQDSVRAGLEQFEHLDYVVVHDAARPLISVALIEAGIDAAAETGAAIAGVPVVDTLKEADADGTVLRTVDRSALWAVQTPQVFDYELLLTAHRRWPGDVTDDAMLVEALGHRVKLFLGSPRNIKVTSPDDLLLAEALLANPG